MTRMMICVMPKGDVSLPVNILVDTTIRLSGLRSRLHGF